MPPQQSQRPQFGQTIATLEGDPFWGDSYASQKRRADVGAEDQQSRALAGLQRAAELKRQIGIEDEASEAEQMQRFGMDRATTGANIADMMSERAAGRQMMPQASAVYQRGREAARQDAYARYGVPAETNAAADVASAQIAGQSRENAAGIPAGGRSADSLMQGLQRAAAAAIAYGAEPEAVAAQMQMIMKTLQTQGMGGGMR